MVNARVHWLLEKATNPVSPSINQQDDPITLLYFSPQGWPAAVSPGPVERQGLTAADCKALWDSLLQNPPPLSAQPEQRGAYSYHVAVQGHLCRYFWLGTSTGEYYFDYSINTGQVRLVIP
ncbi:hypothetical protein CJA_2391 [Cellvibrio japonicus Ueda107]|uniref:Uncharacterized protein n=1 Tax=Cellvibrio japonicus (strain Ueda107) TaxID=498211 RepID=B3PKC3_CELJU|nr:hypothetical protein CJA_2391 [Cellvibrio japonicus Ueda107]